MNKSILVIDTPQKCGDCPMFRFQFYDCVVDNRDVTEEIKSRTRRKDCPFKPLPKKKDIYAEPPQIIIIKGKEVDAYSLGWNDFRDEILRVERKKEMAKEVENE